jgi:hypothetical protein
MRLYLPDAAGGIACSNAAASGEADGFCLEEHAPRGKPNNSASARFFVAISNSPRDHDVIRFQCPDQGNNPSNHRPAENEVQKENAHDVPFASSQGNDRWQKYMTKPKPKIGKKNAKGCMFNLLAYN